uniref:Uncharacterized protein n=1 Tax=Arundo donax TaxID=35708 RepID=A0A0A9CJW8_ARUDO
MAGARRVAVLNPGMWGFSLPRCVCSDAERGKVGNRA